MNPTTINEIPDAWRRIGLENSNADKIKISKIHHHYGSHTPYDSHRPYDSYHSLCNYSQSPRTNRHTLIRKEYFGASICSPSGEPFKINHEGLKFIEQVSKREIVTKDALSEYLSSFKIASQIYDIFIERCKALGWEDAPFNWVAHGG